MQQPGGDRVLQKDTVEHCQRELLAASMYRTSTSAVDAYIRPTPREKAGFPTSYHHSTLRDQSQGLK